MVFTLTRNPALCVAALFPGTKTIIFNDISTSEKHQSSHRFEIGTIVNEDNDDDRVFHDFTVNL